jgi:hypothetical protein
LENYPTGHHHDVAKKIALINPNNHDAAHRAALTKTILPGAQRDGFLQSSEFTVEASAREVKLVVTSLRSLGLADGTCYNDIFAAAKKAGLQLCPAEVGLQLHQQ